MPSAPRICIISTVYLEKRMRPLLAAIARHAQVTLISPDRFPYPSGVLRAEFSGAEPYGVSLFPCRFPIGIRSSTRWVLQSRDLGFPTLNPDVVHIENEAHSFSVFQALHAARFARRRPRVIVSTWGNCWPPPPKGLLLRALLRLSASRIDLFLSANQAGKRVLEREGIDGSRIRVFASTSVDMEHYRPPSEAARQAGRQALGLPVDAFVVGFSGRFVPEKGLVELLEAADLARPRLCKELVVLCAGDGPLKPYLEKRPGVRVLSPGVDGRVLSCYQVMDLLVLASKTTPAWQEQFGRAMVEAMACGVPVVGSRSGAIPEVIGETGTVVDEGDVSQLAEALSTLLPDAARRAALGVAAIDRVRREYSAEAIAAKTLAAYSSVLLE